MKSFTKIQLILLAGIILLALSAAALAAERTGPDSFLPYRAYTVQALTDQVEQNAVVRARLAKHFHVSQDELVDYLKNNIKVITFTSSGWQPVYGVTRTGRIYKSRDYFHKGGKAFGTAKGTAVLKYACGNPLITELPPVPRKKQVEALPMPAPPAPEVVEMPTPPVQAPEEIALLPDAPVAPLVAVPPAVVLAGHKAFPFWLLGVPFLSGGGDDDNPPVVPEPTTLLLLGGGLAILGGRLIRRRR